MLVKTRFILSGDAISKTHKGFIFVVDSNDRKRVGEASEEISEMLRKDELRDAKILVSAIKQDLPNTVNVAKVTDKPGLHAL